MDKMTGFLKEAADIARAAEMENERVDRLDIKVYPHGLSISACRNRRAQEETLTLTWEELESAETNPIGALIHEVVAMINRPPTTFC